MKPGYQKYIPFQPQPIDQTAPGRTRSSPRPPSGARVDLRDGNQALVDPMNLEEKLEYFHTLVRHRLQGDRDRLPLRLARRNMRSAGAR